MKKYKIPRFQPRWNFGIANWNFGTTEKTYNFLEFSGLYVRLYIEIPKSWNEVSPCQSRKKHHLFQNSSWNNWNGFLTEILSRLVWLSKCNASHSFVESCKKQGQQGQTPQSPAPLKTLGILEFWNIYNIYISLLLLLLFFFPCFPARFNNFKPIPNTLTSDSKIPAKHPFSSSICKVLHIPQNSHPSRPPPQQSCPRPLHYM